MSSVEKSDSDQPLPKGSRRCEGCAHHGAKIIHETHEVYFLCIEGPPTVPGSAPNEPWRWPVVRASWRCGRWQARAERGWAPRKVKDPEGYPPETGGARDSDPDVRRWAEMTVDERRAAMKADPERAQRAVEASREQAAQAWESMSEESRKRALRLTPTRARWMLDQWKKRKGDDQTARPDPAVEGPAGPA